MLKISLVKIFVVFIFVYRGFISTVRKFPAIWYMVKPRAKQATNTAIQIQESIYHPLRTRGALLSPECFTYHTTSKVCHAKPKGCADIPYIRNRVVHAFPIQFYYPWCDKGGEKWLTRSQPCKGVNPPCSPCPIPFLLMQSHAYVYQPS